MSTVLLEELTKSDLDWIFENATLHELTPKQLLQRTNEAGEALHLLLAGNLRLILPCQDGQAMKEFAQLTPGELAGSMPALEHYFSSSQLQAITPCAVATIPYKAISEKLQKDVGFAARLYHSQATLLLQRIQFLLQQINLNPAILYQLNLKETTTLFAEMQDGDLDWLLAVGEVQKIAEGQLLQPLYFPIESLLFILDGALSMNSIESACEPISQVFLSAEQTTQQELARLSRGNVFGEMMAVTHECSPVQLKAVRESTVLSISRWRITSKLLYDNDFAMRFYRLLALLLASKYQTIVHKLGFLPQDSNLEFNDSVLSKVALAEARFDWMLNRLESNTVSAR